MTLTALHCTLLLIATFSGLIFATNSNWPVKTAQTVLWNKCRTTTTDYGHYTGQPTPSVKNWMILLVQSFTACVPLLMATIRITEKALESSP